jgi:hypothetical protein
MDMFWFLETFQVLAKKRILGDKDGLRHYSYTTSSADTEKDTMCIVPSSETTGNSVNMPKPVHLTNSFFVTIF